MRNQLAFALLTISIFILSAPLTAAQFKKSRLKAGNSYLDTSKEMPTVVYENNVVYQHGKMTIRADKLIKQGENAGVITAEGSPVDIHYVDQFGETIDIEAPTIVYEQRTGELVADGDIQILQTSGSDTLTLLGNQLRANKRIKEGFSFVLTGEPTKFILKQPNQKAIIAIADTLRSNGKDRKTQLIGSVKLSQGSSNTSAAQLTYDGQTKRISAGQSADGSQPVVTEFYWQDEASQERPTVKNPLEPKLEEPKLESELKPDLEQETVPQSNENNNDAAQKTSEQTDTEAGDQ